MRKEKYNISFSGGRTSAYMTKMLIDNFSDKYEFIVTFANTGLEHEKTLEFVNNCDKYFNFNTVWLEAVVNEGRESTSHKIIDNQSASRNGEPFEEVIKKYGIPNMSFPHCTRELKLNVMRSYLQSIGINPHTIPTALGLRYDEPARVEKNLANKNYKIRCPLATIWPTEKGDVLHWWKQQNFDLGIEEFEGNCYACFKKSNKKQFMQIKKDPSGFEWYRIIDKEYREAGAGEGQRVFFRGNLDTEGLFKLYDLIGAHALAQMDLFDSLAEENGGCTESCEVFPI